MTDEAPERELFEAYFSDHGEYPKVVERNSNGNYKLMTAASAWITWQQSRAPLLARIAELEKQVATARDDALEAAAAICELDLTEAYWYPDAYYPQAIRALKSQHADKGATP